MTESRLIKDKTDDDFEKLVFDVNYDKEQFKDNGITIIRITEE
jgi:hypothetical protein